MDSSQKQIIKPVILKGFRDYLPDQMMARERLIDTARRVYRSYGFSPIDTPALEYSEILLGKGGTESDKQLFRFTDQGDRDVAMRFDLTVPLARYIVQHLHEVGIPFKRYHIATVWRAEKPQKGRFREFMQCDFDTIGTDSTAADIETLLVIHDLMSAIGFTRFQIRVNNRRVLNGLLEKLGVADRAVGVLRALDKLTKIGPEGVRKEMVEVAGVGQSEAERILELAHIHGQPDQVLAQVEPLLRGSEQGELGVEQLSELFRVSRGAGISPDRVTLDLSIARGLDYYTGTVYETFLTDLESIGSVCSGGRYDNLAELFTTQRLPGVGASLGLDRLLAAMEELGMCQRAQTPAQVLVLQLEPARLADYFRVGRLLRAAGIAAEVFPEARPIGKQLKYANRKGVRVAVIAGSDEFERGHWQVKDLETGRQWAVGESELVAEVTRALRPSGPAGVDGSDVTS